ncbi:hypothetical protein ROG8370_01472 [Roseovarius gaetbuli]|uniref:Uncharacterized protein n=1 Tax=Roseovarius gaetbuli TaxID=1356575 RepID=A0A1X6Z1E6_9RHOB|nr:DUF1178 family protein [Roseovarius gaetbuli]SLN35719.1 hypothetical protein ROG8370_01472 [Roseovarius gaetbuli]
MIQFSLKCAEDHRFDSWFQSAEAFEKLRARSMVTCAVCGSDEVEKALMAPRVRSSRKDAPDGAPPQAAGGALSKPASPAEQAMAELRRKIEENSEYVGGNFAREARDMHDGVTPERAIYGEARPEEARKLLEEGVPVAPLPFIPGRKSN